MSPPLRKRRFVSLFVSGGDMGEVFVDLGGMDLLQGAAIALFLCEGLRLEGRSVKAPGQEAAWVRFSRSLG